MKRFGLATAIALVLVSSANVSAAVVVRTAPFPGRDLLVGAALCLVVNAGTTTGSATTVLYDRAGNVLATDAFTLSANVTGIGTYAFLSDSEPAFCKCTIPNTSNWRCSFVYELGSETPPTVIEAK